MSVALSLEKIVLEEKFGLFDAHWNPKIVGALNGQHVKLVKIKGEFVCHKHDHEDELFYVVKGYFDMELRDKTVRLHTGEMMIIPKGVEHRPVASEEAWIMLFEPINTLNTGDIESDMTQHLLQTI